MTAAPNRAGGRSASGRDAPSMSVPMIAVLSGGEILVQGLAVARLEQCVRHALEIARRDGLMPGDVVKLAEALREAVARQRGSGIGTSELPKLATMPASDEHDDLEVNDVARIAGVSPEYARRLCRTTFDTARQSGGRWLVDRIEVEDWAEARFSRRDSR